MEVAVSLTWALLSNSTGKRFFAYCFEIVGLSKRYLPIWIQDSGIPNMVLDLSGYKNK